jgi:hypothetical protein
MPSPRLSAGDWTRLKRLSGARTSGNNANGDLLTNKDINPTETFQIPYSKSMLIPYEAAGVSRILRPASKWTDFIAAGRSDFVTQSNDITNNKVSFTLTEICGCSTTNLYTRIGVCQSCRVA